MNPKDKIAYGLQHEGDPGEACAVWVALLPEAADGLLGEVEQAALDRHLANCQSCAEEFAEAQRGLGWLSLLKQQVPEPPERLLGNILAQTTGAALDEDAVLDGEWRVAGWPAHPAAAAAAVPVRKARWYAWLGLNAGAWSSLLQPRLTMTGAMAFFSICLTLNLLGISIRDFRAQNLSRLGLQRTVADASATAVRSFQGLRLVYRLESRVNELRVGDEWPEKQAAR